MLRKYFCRRGLQLEGEDGVAVETLQLFIKTHFKAHQSSEGYAYEDLPGRSNYPSCFHRHSSRKMYTW